MKIALVGNQNAGKTTIFNILTGSNQKIGNWPGVTIERKEGFLKKANGFEVIDLPGIYSLSPYTSEEEISRSFIINEKPDLIINVVDGTSIERSLYLTTQLLELDVDVIIALNMSDILESRGIKIDVERLSNKLQTTIIPISGLSESGINRLIDTIVGGIYIKNVHSKIYSKDIEDLINKISESLVCNNKRFVAVKLIEDDRKYRGLITEKNKTELKELEANNNMDGEQLIASKRYEYIEKIKKECILVTSKKESVTDKLDRVFLNKWLSLPIFALIMAFVYFLSIGIVGGLTTPLIEVLFNGTNGEPVEFDLIFTTISTNLNFKGIGPFLGEAIQSAGGSPWAISLVQDGIISGVGSVLSFLPQLIVMFLCLSILETTGYMSRIAFFLDKIFHKFGLSGKSLIPFIVGAGCSVPGIASTRIVEDENERKSTMILTPFIPCSAKLPIIALFSSYFFTNYAWVISLSAYLIAIILILIFGYLFKKFIFKGEHSSFVSELPEYRKPKGKYIVRDVYDKSFAFIKKAGTLILLFSIIVWFLTRFSWSFNFLEPENINKSMLAGIGNAFAWFFYPMLGEWSWAASVSAIQGLIAKEQVVASMAIIAGSENVFASGGPFSFLTGPTAYAFMVFNLFSVPCVAAIGALRRESRNVKTLLLTILFEITVAWILATSIGVIGRIIVL